MRSDLGTALLATLLLACGSAQAADTTVVEAYVKFISANKPLAGIGIMQDKKVNGLVIPTDMLTDVFYYRGPARMELVELAATEIPVEPVPNTGEKTEVVKRPVRGVKAATPTHALTPSGKPPVAWIDLPTKQGQLHLILMVNPGKENGITAIEALRMTERQIGNRVHRAAFNTATGRVTEGESLSQALMRTKYFPDLVLDRLAVGENTGNVVPSLKDIAKAFQKDITHRLEMFTNVITTGVLLLVFTFVGFIAFAIVSAVFTLSSSFSH